MKQFHLGDILSLSTGCLVSPDHIGGVYNILNYMTGDYLMTHQLILAAPIMRPAIEEQLPWLREITIEKEFTDDQSVYDWLDEQVNKYGEYHLVIPRPDLWGTHEPIQDLIDIKSGKYSK